MPALPSPAPLRVLRRGIALAGLLVVALVARASTPSVEVRPSMLRPPPAGAVTATTSGKITGDLQEILYRNVGGDTRFARLADTRVEAKFREPVTLRKLALLRIGWPDWALPDRVALALDDRLVGEFTLTAPAISPGKYVSPEPYQVDVVDLGETRTFSKLALLVREASPSRGANTHGTLRVALPVAPPLSFKLSSVGPVPADSIGVEFEVECAAPVADAALIGKANQFRIARWLRAPLPPLPAGRSTHRVEWSRLESDFNLPADISPLNFFELALDEPSGEADWRVVSWKFVTDPARRLTSALESIPVRTWTPDAEGWRQGIPAEGFGRFGWLQNNGLLVGAFSPRTLANTVSVNGAGKPLATATWRIQCGEADVVSWERTRARWTAAEHLAVYEYSAEIQNELSDKEPNLLRRSRAPQRVTGSILAPGILVDSQDDRLRLTLEASGERKGTSPAWILYPTANGLERARLAKEFDLRALSEGWFVVTWDAEPASPVLFAPKKRPSRIQYSDTDARLTLFFEGAFERVALGHPLGYIGPGGKPRGGLLSQQALAERSRLLASLLRAYPVDVAQRFRETDDGIEIEETVSHLFWTNDWNESGRPVAPVAPLLAFAARSANYPVRLPGDLVDSGWDTKYGPYAFRDGHTLRYTLPVPPVETRLYLAPSEQDEVTKHVVARLVEPRVSGKNPLSLDSLAAFGLWSSSSLALPLMDDAGREAFLSAWRELLDNMLSTPSWYLRREPFSGATYPVSFGWHEARTDTLADVNSGLGAALYALYSYARTSGDWDYAAKHWPAVKAQMEYFVVYHDWNNMQSGAREHNGSSAIDMDCIGFQGVLAYAEMARLLGHADDAAWGRFLLSRLGVSLSMRWLGNKWINPARQPADYDSIGVGLSENTGFDLLSSKLGADHVNGELALTLAWLGQFPEVYDAHLWGLGRDFFDWLERHYVEKVVPDWRVSHPGNRNNHPANISTHLYLRGLLGAPLDELRDELKKQTGWGLAPRDIVAQENAALYAMLAGRDFPAVLRSWDRARISRWTYDPATRTATLRVQTRTPERLVLDVAAPLAALTRDRETLGERPDTAGRLHLTAPAGDSIFELRFE
jgi:hypothetical protein